jgi:hypothetical protein
LLAGRANSANPNPEKEFGNVQKHAALQTQQKCGGLKKGKQ